MRIQNLRIVDIDKIRETDIIEKFAGEYKTRLKLVLKSKLNGRNNASILRYRAGFLKWTTNAVKNIVGKSRKIMKIDSEIHPKSHTGRFYLTREKRGCSLVSCDNFVRSEE